MNDLHRKSAGRLEIGQVSDALLESRSCVSEKHVAANDLMRGSFVLSSRIAMLLRGV